MGKVIRMNTNLPEDNSSVPEADEMLGNLLDKAGEMEFDLFEKAVRTNANPPIVGKLTPKKLKEAGIMRCFNEVTMESWLEQRGERISEKFRIVWK
jgi:hypothetical protein